MKMRMAPIRSGTRVKVPRRMAWRGDDPEKISTRFIHEALVGVKCMVMQFAATGGQDVAVRAGDA